jgi:probable F420-dependent oxidoreductase
MLIGLNLPNYSSLGYREAMIAIADAAEALGYSSLWTTDHILVPTRLPKEVFGNLLESLTTLSYIAARTELIGLGTGILVLPQRDPLLVAKQAATLHQLSGGRLTLAVAVGWVEEEYAYLRSDFSGRGALADEYISAIRALFETDEPEFDGRHIKFDDVMFSPRPASPIPIFVGGDSRAALKRAATLGDGWYGWKQSPEQVQRAVSAIDEFGHKEQFEVSLRIATRLGEQIPDADPEATLEGPVDAIIVQIRRYAEAGVDRIVIEPFAADLDDFLDQISRFANEIAPSII